MRPWIIDSAFHFTAQNYTFLRLDKQEYLELQIEDSNWLSRLVSVLPDLLRALPAGLRVHVLGGGAASLVAAEDQRRPSILGGGGALHSSLARVSLGWQTRGRYVDNNSVLKPTLSLHLFLFISKVCLHWVSANTCPFSVDE